MEERVKLNVVGLSANQVKSGAFLLLLGEVNGPYRMPIVIGAAEAQAIAIHMERIITPRPITHDLFCSFAHAFGLELTDVFIYRFEDGIFSSQLTFTDGKKVVKLDSRTSDAIAIAIRTNSPIYTTRQILEAAGTIFSGEELPQSEASNPQPKLKGRPEDMTTDELQAELDRLIAEENYEEAAKISKILDNRRKQ